jgi:Tim44-like domain
MKSDCKLLDLKSVTIQKQEMADDSPMLFVAASTDELIVYLDTKGEIVMGSYNKIVSANYILCITQRQFATPDEEFDACTGGWVVVDWARGQTA